MEAAVLSVIDQVENIRIRILRYTLQFDLLKQAFCSRPARLFFLFSLGVLFYLPLSLYFPLWVLAIGPMIWGIPHIFSSFRYQGYALEINLPQSIRNTVYVIASIWFPVTLFRIYTDMTGSPWSWDQVHPSGIETIAAVLSVVAVSVASKFNWKQSSLSLAMMLPLLFSLSAWPLATVGALILIHNFIAFFYWIFSCRTKADRGAAILATFFFTLIHVLVLGKYFDGLINLFPSDSYLAWSKLNLDQIGQSIAPWSTDGSLWYRCVTLYAFGQALHYFVWLKAIPDVYAPRVVPTNFKQSWKLLKKDLGLRPALWISAIALMPVLVVLIINYDMAQKFYFACASFHGFMEIAGLGLLFSRRVIS